MSWSDSSNGGSERPNRFGSAHLRSLIIGLYSAGEEPAIIECIHACFDTTRDIETWRHFYLDNPAGEAIIMLARHQSAVVSQVAILPRRIQAFGRNEIAGHSLWAMTRPAWQRKGLNRLLAIEAAEIARRRTFCLIYGFANKQSIHGILKYQGRRPVKALPVMLRPVVSLRVAMKLLKCNFDARSSEEKLADSDRWFIPSNWYLTLGDGDIL